MKRGRGVQMIARRQVVINDAKQPFLASRNYYVQAVSMTGLSIMTFSVIDNLWESQSSRLLEKVQII
jgi:hypothetical protein